MEPTARFTGFRTTVGPWRMHALAARAEGAAGPPIVLVHGYGVANRYWRPLAERLAHRFPVYLPDLPGHGRTRHRGAPLDVPGLAGALGGWMDAVGLDRAVLVGNSLGCQVAVELAAGDAGRVAALVLAGPTVDPRARSAGRQFLRLLLSGPVEHPAILPIIFGDYRRTGLARLRAELRHMLRHRIETLLPSVAAPTLVIRGMLDRVAPRRWAAEAAALLQRGSLVEIPFAGHAAHYTRPDRVAAHVIGFLATVPGWPPPAGGTPPARAAPGPGARA